MKKIVIYTQNCSWWPITNRKKYFKLINDFIEQAKPDIVFLQEIFDKKWVKHFEIEGYTCVFEAKKIFLHGGLVIMVKNSIEVESCYIGRFQSQFGFKPKQFLSSLLVRRGFLHVYLPHFNLHLVNSHLTAGFSRNHKYNPTRFMQVNQLKNYVSNLGMCIFGGDLNFHEHTPEHELLKVFCKDLTAGVGNTFASEKGRYDYIFSSNIKKISAVPLLVPWYEHPRFFGGRPIDHHGIITQVQWED